MSKQQKLEGHLHELKAAKAEFEHQLRRFGDATERTGGILGALETDFLQLQKNLKQTDTEIAEVEAALTNYNKC